MRRALAFILPAVLLAVGMSATDAPVAEKGAVVSGGRDLFVDPKIGDDAATGLSPTVKGASGPLKAIARAVRLSRPGDTIHLAKAVYHESIDLTGKAGEPGKPLVIDGHGAVIDGSRPINPSEWKEVAPGLYRNTVLFVRPLRKQETWVWRWFMIFDGKVNRMGRCMKGNNAPYKNPADLRPGEWSYQQNDEHAFYIRIDRSTKLADCRIETPWEVNGVSVHGANHDLVIRNLTATRVINDGYNISPVTQEAKIHDILFENIASIECGDDGLSAHGDSTVQVEGFYSTLNGTGICTTGSSVNNRLRIVRNVGWEVYFYESPTPGPTAHVITNSFIECGAANAFRVMAGKLPDAPCALKLENVVILAEPGVAPSARTLRMDPRTRLEARALTTRGLSFDVQGQGLSLTSSVVAGGPECSISIGATAEWEACRNIYDIGGIRAGGKAFTSAEFAATGRDAGSRWEKVDVDRILTDGFRLSVEGNPVGADLSLIPRSVPSSDAR